MQATEPWVCVLGASNMDLLTKVPRLPKLGETLIGRFFHLGCGGKGANQAVMARKLGARVTMITKLGRDMFGEYIFRNYQQQGIDTTYVLWDEQRFSGVAPIFVDDEGRNMIVIVPGANFGLTPEDVHRAREAITRADVVVCQLEVPLEVTAEALRLAKQDGRALTIFNPAPGQPLPQELVRLSDVIAPNETEAEAITGLPIRDLPHAESAARQLLATGAGAAIITLGERGALVADPAGVTLAPAIPVKAVDSTGAGDAFIGTLAYFLAQGAPLRRGVHLANAAAAISVTRVGTQVSFPWRAELDAFLETLPQ
ncbi:MAG: ribokinase [Armatimonadota bacterium]|nr:ribokinase [Armatimonadota bacterium]MDR7426986.1 ribokinase [Armatimonadota bacterium]MDR7463096.1 ribokinase [Armatimonadota bacterium]MDR7469321.1 ribokinase [Armatimonadota bacterium]MDR7475513.1 ribokinase [Armatimonadota bacterium]